MHPKGLTLGAVFEEPHPIKAIFPKDSQELSLSIGADFAEIQVCGMGIGIISMCLWGLLATEL